MPYVQNTDEERGKMLRAMGLEKMEDLFAYIPENLRSKGEPGLPEGLTELEVMERVRALGARNRPAGDGPFFLGAGVYRHFIPAVVDQLANRAEFKTAYTPYQPELSQGLLQAFFEYQTMICMLTGMEIANASMYDGASALAEAALMTLQIRKGRRKLLVSGAIHPEYRRVLQTYLEHMEAEIVEISCPEGTTDLSSLERHLGEDTAAVLLQHPNFFGLLEDMEGAARLAKEGGALFVVSVDPLSLSVLKPPGAWGADIVTGEGQGLGVPMSFGGPGFGFLAARADQVRRMPGRIVGQTRDREGRPGYVLTFQTREQHIRRERATSNICTNHALMALRAAIHLAALGSTGFRKLGQIVLEKAHRAAERITALPGYERLHAAPFFKEFAVRTPRPAAEVNRALLEAGIVGGYDLGLDYPGQGQGLLLCVTEMTSDTDVDRLIDVLKGIE